MAGNCHKFTIKKAVDPTVEEAVNPIVEKLKKIVIPRVSYSGRELSRVVEDLSELSVEFDNTNQATKGVNITLIDPEGTNPRKHLFA